MTDSTTLKPLRDQPGHLLDLLDLVLNEAKRLGADAAEADIGVGDGLSATVRMGEVETLEHQRDKGLGVVVYQGQRKGSASSSDLSPAALTETVQAALAIAAHTKPDPCAGLADPALLASTIPDLDLYHPWPISPQDAIARALACEQIARDTDARIVNADGTTLATASGAHVYGNSHGFHGYWQYSRHSLDCTVIAKDASGMQRDGWQSQARVADELDSLENIGKTAARRTVDRLGARRLNTRSAPVIFEAPVAGSLFGHLVNALSGGNLYRRSSFLLDQVGEQIFPNWLRVHEQPHLRRGLRSAAFDDEGVTTRARDLVTAGVLQGYVLGSYSARKLGLQTTGNAGGVHNLCIEPGSANAEQYNLPGLLKLMDTGLLVTDLMGFGVNIMTGDYSRGVSGYWVENGEIAYPVEEITIAGNLADLFKGIVATGQDIDPRRSTRTGSVLIDKLMVAGE